MTETWRNCPLMKQYRNMKRTYIKEMMLERWKDGQRVELWNAIELTFDEITDPKKEYWKNRLFSYYCKRFKLLTKCSWLIFLGEMDDIAAYGTYKDTKARYYCCLVRNMAYWLTHQTEPYRQSA